MRTVGELKRIVWESIRPTTCRQCGEWLFADHVIADPENPWLAFHEQCLEGAGADRVVRIYDELAHTSPNDYQRRAAIEGQIVRLEDELGILRLMIENRLEELGGTLRPGVRRVMPPK
jgi:hypothetical protein